MKPSLQFGEEKQIQVFERERNVSGAQELLRSTENELIRKYLDFHSRISLLSQNSLYRVVIIRDSLLLLAPPV